jgi:hypothetical protein
MSQDEVEKRPIGSELHWVTTNRESAFIYETLLYYYIVF